MGSRGRGRFRDKYRGPMMLALVGLVAAGFWAFIGCRFSELQLHIDDGSLAGNKLATRPLTNNPTSTITPDLK